jgi:hypothetical protein
MTEPTAPRTPQSSPRRSQRAVLGTLLTCVAGLFLYVAQAPAEKRDLEALRQQRAAAELAWRLDELRAVIESYRARHGKNPGQGADSGVDADWFERAYGASRASRSYDDATTRLPDGVPANPINGRSDVRFLAPDEAWPEEADDLSGWLYKPATGELRANCRGRRADSGRAHYAL